MISKPLSYFAVLTVLWVSCQSCFQFRKSDKKQFEALSVLPQNFNVEIGTKRGLDRDIHYTLVSSSKPKPLAVFIHGSPGSSSNFLQFANDTVLLEKYDVLLLDRPGFGYSDFGNAEPSILHQADILNKVMAQFDYPKIILIGHSLGGPIIANMAMKEPENYYGLLIVAGSVSPDLEPKEWWRNPLNAPLVRWMFPKSLRVSNQEILPAKSELEKMESQWERITSKVRIIQGGKDNLVPAGNANYAKEKLVNATEVKVDLLPQEDHFIPFMKPQLISASLLKF